jgi:3-isopropylmalate dehydrogenase
MASMSFSILVLPGDGIGPEVTNEALKVISLVSSISHVEIEIKTALLGGCSIDKYGVPVTDDVLALAKDADAVLMGAVGGPKWCVIPTVSLVIRKYMCTILLIYTVFPFRT